MSKREVKISLKRNKIIEGFDSCGYDITKWFIDFRKSSCDFFVVRSRNNMVEFLCTIPSTYSLAIDNGTYLIDCENTPDIEAAVSMWNECDLQNLFIKIVDKYVVKIENEYRIYTEYSGESSQTNELDKYANELNVIKDDDSNSDVKAVISKNPFDILMYGGTLEKVPQKRIDELQPCILTDYVGYTLGQAIPIMDFLDFFNNDDLSSNLKNLTIDVKEIYKFQSSYIENLYVDAIKILKEFTKKVEENYNKYTTDNENCSNEFHKLLNIINAPGTNSKSNNIKNQASNILNELLNTQIEKRDSQIQFLQSIVNAFSEI